MPRPDVSVLLARVGLAGFEERETAGLSGGELQRLAIAASLAREPRLLISDEATAMIDAPGRAEVVATARSRSPPAGSQSCTSRIDEAEAAKADLAILMLAGRLIPSSLSPRAEHDLAHARRRARSREVAREARRRDVSPGTPKPPGARGGRGAASPSFACGSWGTCTRNGTPWARRALEGRRPRSRRGEGIVVTGDNGSGKSTLAWILAGLSSPTEGEALLEGKPIVAGTGCRGDRLPARPPPAHPPDRPCPTSPTAPTRIGRPLPCDRSGWIL